MVSAREISDGDLLVRGRGSQAGFAQGREVSYRGCHAPPFHKRIGLRAVVWQTFRSVGSDRPS